MSTEKKTIILDLQIPTNKDAISELEKIKSLIIQNKQEQQNLAQAYKKGQITLQEYSRETVKVEAILKKQSNDYNQLSKNLTGTKTQFDKLIDSNKKVASSLHEATDKINVAGVSVGDITGKLASFANPATAAVGILTALGNAYASSSKGARDLQIAQDTLRASISILNEGFGDIVSTITGQDSGGQGLFEYITDGLLFQLSPALATTSKLIADAKQQLRDLEISRAFAAGDEKTDEKRAELQRRIRDDEDKSFQERLEASKRIDENFRSIQERTTTVIKAEIQGIKESTIGYDNNREAQLKVAELTSEIADLEEKVTGKLTENVNARKKILQAIEDQKKAERDQALIQGTGDIDTSKDAEVAKTQIVNEGKIAEDKEYAKAKINIDKRITDHADKLYKEDLENYYKNLQARRQAQQEFLVGTSQFFMGLSSLFKQGSEAQKQFALLGLLVDTAEAIGSLTAAAEANPFNSVSFGGAGILQFAAGLLRITANIAAAKKLLDFDEGGYTGDGGKHDIAGYVHRGEVVWNQDDVRMAGGAHRVNAMRPTFPRSSFSGQYFDGGIVANQLSGPIQQQMMVANAIKNMPQPVIGLKEFNRKNNQVSTKESASRFGA